MLKLSVPTEVCTFHFAGSKGRIRIPATVAVPVTLVESADGETFTFSYTPNAHSRNSKSKNKALSESWACPDCAENVVPKILDFKEWVRAKIAEPVRFEEDWEEPKAEESEEENEEGEELEEEDDDQEEDEEPEDETELSTEAAAAVVESQTSAGMVAEVIMDGGPKVVPQATFVSTPPEVQKKIDEAVSEPWRALFPAGYEPPTTAPKDAEREACEKWFILLSAKDKRALAPRGFPSKGRWPVDLVKAWYTSSEYRADWFKANA